MKKLNTIVLMALFILLLSVSVTAYDWHYKCSMKPDFDFTGCPDSIMGPGEKECNDLWDEINIETGELMKAADDCANNCEEPDIGNTCHDNCWKVHYDDKVRNADDEAYFCCAELESRCEKAEECENGMSPDNFGHCVCHSDECCTENYGSSVFEPKYLEMPDEDPCRPMEGAVWDREKEEFVMEEEEEKLYGLIESIEGDVEIKRKGTDKFVKAKVGDKLWMGDYVSTGFESHCKMKFGDIAILTVREMSQFAISHFFIQGNAAKTAIDLRVGEVTTDVNPIMDVMADFEIETPTSTVATRGTKFTVNYDEDSGETTVSLSEGSVEVSSKFTDDTAIVETGKIAKVTADGEIIYPSDRIKESLTEDNIAKPEGDSEKGIFGRIIDFFRNVVQLIREERTGESPADEESSDRKAASPDSDAEASESATNGMAENPVYGDYYVNPNTCKEYCYNLRKKYTWKKKWNGEYNETRFLESMEGFKCKSNFCEKHYKCMEKYFDSCYSTCKEECATKGTYTYKNKDYEFECDNPKINCASWCDDDYCQGR